MRLLNAIAVLLLMSSVLLSSTGIRLSHHWCGEQLVSASIFGEASPCSHFQANEPPVCPLHTLPSKKNKCCDQRQTVIDGNDYDYEAQALQFFPMDHLLAVLVLDCLTRVTLEDLQYSVKFHNHSPPLIGADLRITIASFLL